MQTITWGMIGCGDVTEVKNGPGLYLAEHSKLKGITNRTKSKAIDWAKRHQQGIVYDSVEDLLKDDEIDIVYIAVTPDKHMEYAILCAKAGKHCLIEKPLAMTYEEGVAIWEAFNKAGKKAYVAFYRRSLNRFLKVKELLSSGKIGRVSQFHIHRYVHPLTDTNAWRAKPEISGGNVFTETDIHILDCMDELFGEVKQFQFMKNSTDGNDFDSLVMNFQYENNIYGTGDWCYNAEIARDQVDIIGERGMISFDFFHNDAPIILETKKGREEIIIKDSIHVGLAMEQAIVNELNGVGKFHGNIDAALRTLKITDSIYQSEIK